MSFFKKLDEKEWQKKKQEAADYDDKEFNNALADDGILTSEKLKKIASAKKVEKSNTDSSPKK
jgi:hypothetical protein